MEDITVRKAVFDDFMKLAAIHFKSYTTRFFDQNALDISGKPYGVPLAVEHPNLARGQTQNYFNSYWRKFAKTLWDGSDKSNICFVATLSGREVGFVKGNAAPASAADYPAIANLTGNIGELGSIYMLPEVKLRGCGQKLVRRYVKELAAGGFDQMVTSAYYKNDSPAFFEKLGANILDGCDIPNDYLDVAGKLVTENIKGILLHWPMKAFADLQSPRPVQSIQKLIGMEARL